MHDTGTWKHVILDFGMCQAIHRLAILPFLPSAFVVRRTVQSPSVYPPVSRGEDMEHYQYTG